MNNKLINIVEQRYLNSNPPQFRIGDTVDVYMRIIEGERERIQVFNGVVIARRGQGLGASFTVRRIVANEGVERVFPLHSPRISKIDVKRHGKVRRAKLFYLRDRVGKARRLREKRRIGGKRGTGAADSEKASITVGGGERVEAVEVAGQPA